MCVSSYIVTKHKRKDTIVPKCQIGTVQENHNNLVNFTSVKMAGGRGRGENRREAADVMPTGGLTVLGAI